MNVRVIMTLESSKVETPQLSRTNSRDRLGLLIVCASTVFVSLFLFRSTPLQSANDRSRWCTVWSLVERGTYQINEIDRAPRWSTIDKVRHKPTDADEWSFYSSKPPLLSTIVAGVYWLERSTVGWDLRERPNTVSRGILFFVNIVPWFFALLSLRKSMRLLQVSSLTRLLILASAGFGSMLLPFLTTLNNHTPAAISLIFCLAAITRLSKNADRKIADFVIVGFTAALTVCFELPAALFGLMSFFFVMTISFRKTIKFYVPAALVPLAAFFLTNWICTGGIKPFYAYYGTEKYVYVHEGVPSYWSSPQGIDANTESPAIYLFHCILGHHGLLSLTPIFLLTIWGWCTRKPPLATRAIHWAGAFLSVVVLIFYLSRTENYNYGGNTAALRWMLWLAPFWWYGMIPAFEKILQNRLTLGFAVVLLGGSIFSAAHSISTPWQPGWIFQSMQSVGLIDYKTKVAPFEPPRYSILGRIRSGETGVWKNATTKSQSVLTLTALTQKVLKTKPYVVLKVALESPTSSKHETVVVDLNQFQLGNDVIEWLKPLPPEWQNEVNNNATDEPARQRRLSPWVVKLLRGIPNPRPYNAESPRYLKYTKRSGERWAIKCLRGASRVRFRDADKTICWQRCDVMYSDEVPFGVASWETVVTEEGSNNVRRRNRWITTELPD